MRRFRFRLRTLVTATLLLGTLSGVFGSRAMTVLRAHRNVRLLEQQGGVVTSDFQERYGLFPWQRRATWQSVLEWSMASPDEVSANFARSPQVRQFVEQLGELQTVRRLDLAESEVSSDDVKHLKSLHRLEDLCLSGTAIDDSALDSLAMLPKLRTLDLAGTSISDAALRPLAGMNSLETVNLTNTGISRHGLRELRRERPDLVVSRAPRRKTRTWADSPAPRAAARSRHAPS